MIEHSDIGTIDKHTEQAMRKIIHDCCHVQIPKLQREIERLSKQLSEAADKYVMLEMERYGLIRVTDMLASACVAAKGQIIRDNSGCYPLPYGNESNMLRKSACDQVGDALFQYSTLTHVKRKGNIL